MTGVDDLATWLRAQLDEDERVALTAQPGPWTMRGDGSSTPWTDIDAAEGTVTSSYEGDVVAVSDAEHIVRWDPARVLAEVAAKRRIIRMYENAVAAHKAGSISQYNRGIDYGASDVLGDTVRLLAVPYADRDGYREEWAVTT